MHKCQHFRPLILIAASLVFAVSGFGQDNRPGDGQPPDPVQMEANQPKDIRSNALRQLGLSSEQIQQIRRINMARRPLMEEAQRRFREANRSLDTAIYADQINEDDIRERLKEVQSAQAEISKIRFMNEVAVRRLLTAEQLVLFRELRERFEKARDNFPGRRAMNRQDRGNEPKPMDNPRPVRRFLRNNPQRPN